MRRVGQVLTAIVIALLLLDAALALLFAVMPR
jgi:hypothetical protein